VDDNDDDEFVDQVMGENHKKRKRYLCYACGGRGHTRKSCPNPDSEKVAQHVINGGALKNFPSTSQERALLKEEVEGERKERHRESNTLTASVELVGASPELTKLLRESGAKFLIKF